MNKKDGVIQWVNVYKDMSAKGIARSFLSKRQYALAKDKYTATTNDDFTALSIAIRDRLIERWIDTQQRYHKHNAKRVYYLSMEFLIGRLLGTNIMNLGLWDKTREAMEGLGRNLEEMRECESDAGLGNGGLGRLAACVLDSMATLGIPAHGYGIRYEYGIFNQKIINGYQVESPEEWLARGNPWEFRRLEYTTRIRFHGRTEQYTDSEGRLMTRWTGTEDVLATPYDIPVAGYKNGVVNTLRLWSARSTEEFDFNYFNSGDYEHAVYNKVLSENISKVLYPNDNISQGRELRLKQEYFCAAASISDIIRRYKQDNADIRDLPKKVAIQLNDTHLSIAIVELMRRLIDEEGLEWETAWDIVVKTFAYTNHTVMPEALECWPVPVFEALLPRHMQIIYEINMRLLKDVTTQHPGDTDRLRRLSIIEEGEPKRIRMAHLAIIGSHCVNGVSELHTELIKTRIFKDFFEFCPECFLSITNGITQRRWLKKANVGLASLITEAIGDKWATDLYELKHLERLTKDHAFTKKWNDVKQENKKVLSEYIRKTTAIIVDPNSLFDVQIKRMHEYKRQLLLGLYIISQYLKVKENPNAHFLPRTFIIGGKAAPGYAMAKLIIKFINSIAEAVNRDRATNDKIKVVFMENYRVSLAEKIFPASELSEQISAAGTEASGTSCMKFAVNGALTIGTLDGANIEIAREVGNDNIFIFGLTVNDIQKLVAAGYNPRDFIDRSDTLKEVLNLIRSNFFSTFDHGLFDPILDHLMNRDTYYICADFDLYCLVQERVSHTYRSKNDWIRKSILNVARSGKFSSDRTVAEYAKKIWDISYHKP